MVVLIRWNCTADNSMQQRQHWAARHVYVGM
jgi:hypothetical protein